MEHTMKNCWMLVNLEKEHAPQCACRAAELLLELGYQVWMEDTLLVIDPPRAVRLSTAQRCLSQADFLVAVGGDGTIIHTAKYAVQRDIPLLGINAGHLGFLAQLEAHEVEKLPELLTSGCEVQSRMILQARVFSQSGEELERVCALNEVLLSKGSAAKIVDLEVTCQGKPVSSYRADGIILSTAIGSTGYALSAGGPILDPCVDCISMTPVCPHSLFGRSIVFAPDQELRIQGKYINNTESLVLSIDGEAARKIHPGDYVLVRRSEKRVKFLCVEGRDFYEILNEKIMTRG